MFLGHYGVAFALKRAEPKVSLAVLFVACQLVDIAFGATVLLGWERVAVVPGATAVTPLIFDEYPLTHSLVAGAVWALAMAAAWYSWPTRDTAGHFRASMIVGLAVMSHWFLDAIAHVPDLPLAGADSTKVGLGLWNSLPGTLVVELALFGGGLALWLKQERGRKRQIQPARVAVLAGLLVVLFAVAIFGPPPPDPRAVGWTALALVVPALIAAWASRTA